VAISSHSSHFINTDCFSQVLTRIWFNKLANMDESFFRSLKMITSLLTLGLLAPWLISYRLAENSDEVYLQDKNRDDSSKVTIL
jgi:hypothetical protein